MQRSRLFLAAFCCLLLVSSGCVLSFAGIRGSGDTVSIQDDFSGFDSIRLSQSCQANVAQGDYSFSLRIDDNLEQYLVLEQNGSTLRVGLESGHSYRNVHCEADIRMPDLKGIDLSGGSRATLENYRAHGNVTLDLSGGSRIEGVLEADDLEVDTSGGAMVELSGRSESVGINSSGGAQVSLGGMETGPVYVNMSGGSRATVNVDGAITGSISGAASLRYDGQPTDIRVSKSGAARVTRR